MLYIILLVIVTAIGGYFTFHYVSLLYAFRQITRELDDIQQDLSRNQFIHLPIPNRHLKKLLTSFNTALDAIQKERRNYAKREKEFQRQIENVSHDLRTPLTVILGYLKLINDPDNKLAEKDQELIETMSIIERKAETMKNLVAQFYDFSRINTGDYELSLNHVDASRVLRESLMGNYQILEQAHLQIETEIPDYPIWILGEESALERIFLNLLQNASRYADTYLCISIREDKESITILFINDTNTLTDAEIPHLFDRFYMQDSSRNQGGTGLGLTVAKSLAEKMGAELNAYIPNGESSDSDSNSLKICFELCMKSSCNL